jgi:glycosyltransferase involved in cell wall biosynthesis
LSIELIDEGIKIIKPNLGANKIKVLTLGDMPLSPSGVGTQSKYFCEALLKTGKFHITSLGGAIKHENYSPIKTEEFKDDWVLFPVDGYGNEDVVRSVVRQQRPDIIWFMTDPRFWGWLWGIENELRPHVPMIYHHVWDNYPTPHYNKLFYKSNDYIACISKVTHDIVQKVAPDVPSSYTPHAVDPSIFKNLEYDETAVRAFKEEHIGSADKMFFFWNNRNARRKQSGSLIFWFKEFLDKVGHDKATLVMHTNTKDPNGQDLDAIVARLGLDDGQVLFSREAIQADKLAAIYNMADCTINVSDAEGFGLSTLESLACGTPIIVNMTGGLQEQVTDGKN